MQWLDRGTPPWFREDKGGGEDFRIEHRGKQITGLAVMRMDEGTLSRPAEHRGLKEERVSSHHAGVVGERVRTESSVALIEEARVTSGGSLLELTETKWSFSTLAKVLWSVLKEVQESVWSFLQAWLSVLHRVEEWVLVEMRR